MCTYQDCLDLCELDFRWEDYHNWGGCGAPGNNNPFDTCANIACGIYYHPSLGDCNPDECECYGHEFSGNEGNNCQWISCMETCYYYYPCCDDPDHYIC